MPTKVHLVKAMVFLVVTYGSGSWTIKRSEYWRIDAFELWCWRRLLRVPWTARRSNQSFLKEISPEYSLEGLMLKLKLQYLATWCKELTHLKRPWCWEILRAGGEGDDRGWHGWMASPTRWTWVWVDYRRWWWTGKPDMLQFVGSQRVRHYWATELIVILIKSILGWGHCPGSEAGVQMLLAGNSWYVCCLGFLAKSSIRTASLLTWILRPGFWAEQDWVLSPAGGRAGN